jgi:hypothetical protein
MKIEKATAGSETTEAKRNIVASIEFAVRASLHEEYVDADFVHSILGKITAKSEDRGDEEDAGYVKASLVQFGEAMDHGISTERLGDSIEGGIAEYWELLFDLNTGCWKEEVQDEYEASGCDLLIIDRMEISPRFRGTGVGPIAIDRTIDIFGPVCGLIACKPWPLQFTPAFARDRKALNRLKAPNVGRDEAIHKLRAYWSRLGFWPLGETGIYLLGMAQRGSGESSKNFETLASRPRARPADESVRTLPSNRRIDVSNLNISNLRHIASDRPVTVTPTSPAFPEVGIRANIRITA